MKNHLKRIPERAIWMGVTAFFLAVTVVLAFSPRVLAGNQEAEKRRLLGMFESVLDFVQQNYVDADIVETQTLIEGAMKGMFDALGDPHSAYLTSKDMQDMSDTTTGKFGGVGLIISKVDKGAEVVSPIEDTPAHRAGVSAGDIIIAIDGEPVVDLSINDVVKILRGVPGTEVTMTVLRGKAMTFDVAVARGVIEVPTVKHAMIPEDIGYLRIIQFTPLTSARVKESIEEFRRQGYRSLVVDLRSNPGGLLPAVIDTADYFISSGPIVSTRSRIASENHVFYASPRDTIVAAELPVIVLIDRGSASASEILAGALKDTARATLIGEKSYGKGSVQQIRSVGDGGFRLTTSRYYTPGGISIDKVGIQPDVVIVEPELSTEEEESFTRLLGESWIRDFVAEHPRATEGQVRTFLSGLKEEGIVLRERLVRRLIRNEANRTNNSPPVYDLEYDTVLSRAVEMLKTEAVGSVGR